MFKKTLLSFLGLKAIIAHTRLKIKEIVIAEYTAQKTTFFSKGTANEIMLKIINLTKAERYNKQQNGDILFEKIGSPYYIAPEVLRKNYNAKCDIWSAGVIFFYLLYGNFPFMGENDDEIYAKIKIRKYLVNQNVKVSEKAVDLLQKMLDYSPYMRLSAYDCLNILGSIKIF